MFNYSSNYKLPEFLLLWSLEDIINSLPFLNKAIQDKVIEHLKQKVNDSELPSSIRFGYAETYSKILERLNEGIGHKRKKVEKRQ